MVSKEEGFVFSQKSLMLLLSQGTIAVLSFVGLTMMTRLVGPEYNVIMWCLATVTLFSSLSDLSFSGAYTRHVAEGNDKNDCFSTLFIVRVCLISASVALVLVSVLVSVFALHNNIDASTLVVLGIFIAYRAVLDFSNIFITAFYSRLEVAKSELIRVTEIIIRIPLIVILSLAGGSALLLGFGYLAGAIATLALGFYFIRRTFVLRRPKLFRSFLSFALPMAGVTVLTQVMLSADKALLGVLTSVSEVGLFSAGQGILSLMMIISTSISMIAFPKFVKMIKDGRGDEIGAIMRQAERYVLMFGLPIAIVIILFPFDLSSSLLGTEFRDAGHPIRFLAIATLASMMMGLYTYELMSMNKPRFLLKAYIIAVPAYIISILTLVPYAWSAYGFEGRGAETVALCYAAVYLILAMAFKLRTEREYPTHFGKCFLRQVTAATVTAIAMVALDTIVPVSGLVGLAAALVVAYVIFFAVLTLLRGFTSNDLRIILGTLHMRKLLEYTKGEITSR